jgi:hypothetical protein
MHGSLHFRDNFDSGGILLHVDMDRETASYGTEGRATKIGGDMRFINIKAILLAGGEG